MPKLSESSIRSMLHAPTYFLAFNCHLVYFSVAMNTYKGVYSLFLGVCKPTFYTFYTRSEVKQYVQFIIQTSDRTRYFTIFQHKLHSVNVRDDQSWAFSETVKKNFQNHSLGRPVLVSSASCQCNRVFE